MTNDDIFGCTLEEYLDKHETTKENLISKIEIDIKLLNDSLHYQVHELDMCNSDLVEVIAAKLDNKRKHLKTIKQW